MVEEAMAEQTKAGDQGPERQPNEPEQKRPVEQQGGERTRSRPTFRPFVDIYEVENGLVLLADVPGASPEGVTATLEGQSLTIHAQVAEHAPEGYSLVYQEYEVGDYECQFTLSGEFDADKIAADLTNGGLRLTIPKAAEAQARKIQIRSES